MARTSRIDDPDFAKAVAYAYTEGLTQQQIADEFGMSDRGTVARWIKDPRVVAHAKRFADERIQRIIRKTDTEIEKRMANIGQEDIDIILKIRKEYLNNAVRLNINDGATDETVNETLEELESNPELAAALHKMLNGEPKAASGAE